jgi:hypothetical protein
MKERRSDPRPIAQESAQKLLLLFSHPSADSKNRPYRTLKIALDLQAYRQPLEE